MGYIFNNYLPLSTTQPHHHLLTHCDTNGNDHRELITTSSEELGDRKNNEFPAARTSRWNPTPEQITTLEEIYRSGIRTPTTDEIQEIASKLKKYGRIEGKNVFYWFQNHKARERLKRRRSEGGDPTNKPHKDVKDSSSGAQHELGLSNYNRDNINVNDEDYGTIEESERVSEDGKEATWRNLVTWSIIQEPGEINMDEYVNGKEEEEETREIRTLNLFPVIEKEEQTGRLTEKTKEQMYCNYCYFYEFLPLKN